MLALPPELPLFYLLSDELCVSKRFASHLLLLSRWVCSEWANVRPPDRFFCALPATGVPTRQALCAGRLRSTRPGDGRSYAGWGGQGNALCPQRGKAVLSPGMQVHTPADQLLSPIEGGMDRETRRRCEIALPAHLHTEPQRRCVVSAVLYVRPTHTQTHRYNMYRSRPLREGQAAGQIWQRRGRQIWAASDGQHVQCGVSSTPAWFQTSQCPDWELRKTV